MFSFCIHTQLKKIVFTAFIFFKIKLFYGYYFIHVYSCGNTLFAINFDIILFILL